MRFAPFFSLCLMAFGLSAFYHSQSAQTLLGGMVTDQNGEPMTGVTVKITQNAILVKGGNTDINGQYKIELEPGVYDVEFTYTGYPLVKYTGVQVLKGKINTLDISMTTQVQEEVVIQYERPLIKQDKTMSGQEYSSEGIKKLPTKNVIGASPAPASKDEEAAKMKGSRSEGNYYNVDGISVSGIQPSKPEKTTEKLSIAGKKEAKTTPYAEPVQVQPADPADFNTENYSSIYENNFLPATEHPVSTFSIDVDVAAYSNLRRFLNAGEMPPRDAVRIEEMINYFDYTYPAPQEQHPFSINTELSVCPWAPEHRLLLIGLQGRQIETGQLPSSNFVFLVDVSGSMNEANKLPLVQQSLQMLIDQLRPQDKVAIVVYAGAAGVVLPATSGNNKTAMREALNRLQAGGSTAGAAGIRLAYQIARENYVNGGNNRVILCTDGDFNVGVSSESELVQLIEKERESNVYLTVLGFGTGNYQDAKMQQLADKGNGNHAYIDQAAEAKKVLISEFGGTLFAIAKDVKLQLEFNPARVAGYRLIGYENRMLAREDFDNDAKDAGELGAGHRVTALYEIVPAGQSLPVASAGGLKYQSVTTNAAAQSNELLTLKFRYKVPKANATSTLIETIVYDQPTETPGNNLQLAASIASFGMVLRDSPYKGTCSYTMSLEMAKKAALIDPFGYRTELVNLIEKAKVLATPLEAKR